jgi:hypothetical protein
LTAAAAGCTSLLLLQLLSTPHAFIQYVAHHSLQQ